MRRVALGAALLAVVVSASAEPPLPVDAPAATTASEVRTTVRLMVLNEVTSHTAKAGDRFPLLVDKPLVRDGAVVAPVGTKAWGEVVETHENGSAGTAGRLRVRLLWIDAPSGRIAFVPEDYNTAGYKAYAQTAIVAVGMTFMAPLALFARGNNAKFKAGEIVEGVVEWPATASTKRDQTPSN